MKKNLFSLGFVFAAITLSAQTNTVTPQTSAKAIYFELAGPGLASINYDMRFAKKEDGLGFRVGVGGLKIEDEGALFIPIGLNYLLGKDKKNYFEIGGGVTLVNTSSDGESNFTGTFGHLNFGYRFQPKDGGFFFRAAMNPIFGDGFFVPYYGGIAFGYKF